MFLTRLETVEKLKNSTTLQEAFPIIRAFLYSLGYDDVNAALKKVEEKEKIKNVNESRTESNQTSPAGAVAG